MARESREKMVWTTAQLLRERGLTGTSLRDVIEVSNAPRGSIYHHFPGGKAQLVGDAVTAAGSLTSQAIASTEPAADPAKDVWGMIEIWRNMLESTDFRGGCAVAAVAMEAPRDPDSEQLPEVAAAIFAEWRQLIAERIATYGPPPELADKFATLMLAAIEGAIMLCRAERSTRPLDEVGEALELLTAAFVAQNVA